MSGPTARQAAISEWPRLLYVGDVPVEASYHGSALLYRLLLRYPADKLLVVEAAEQESEEPRRLRGRAYRRVRVGSRLASRLVRTRFDRVASAIQLLLARFPTAALHGMVREFAPEAVLSVAHGHAWIEAARIARVRAIPLHLIIHDDLPAVAPIPDALRGMLDRELGRVYRQAASRFCVSPSMAEDYRQRYGAEGTVLYPLQGPEALDAPRGTKASGEFTVAYAGNIAVGDYPRALRSVANALQAIGGRLVLFGPFTAQDARRFGLDLPNVQFRGSIPNARMIAALRQEADALFVPMSFEDGYQTAMRLSFPSKMTDYTATGVPMLIRGPDYSSAVRWARENPGCAEVVATQSESDLLASLNRLRNDAQYRTQLSTRALAVGSALFGYQAVTDIFLAAIASARRPRP